MSLGTLQNTNNTTPPTPEIMEMYLEELETKTLKILESNRGGINRIVDKNAILTKKLEWLKTIAFNHGEQLSGCKILHKKNSHVRERAPVDKHLVLPHGILGETCSNCGRCFYCCEDEYTTSMSSSTVVHFTKCFYFEDCEQGGWFYTPTKVYGWELTLLLN